MKLPLHLKPTIPQTCRIIFALFYVEYKAVKNEAVTQKSIIFLYLVHFFMAKFNLCSFPCYLCKGYCFYLKYLFPSSSCPLVH